MRDARGGGGPSKPQLISEHGAGQQANKKPRTISQQLAHYNRSQGTSRGHGGAAQILTPKKPSPPRRDYPSAKPLKKPPGLHPAEIGHYFNTLGKYTVGLGMATPTQMVHNLSHPLSGRGPSHPQSYRANPSLGIVPWMPRVGSIKPAMWREGEGGIPRGPGMPKSNADLEKIQAEGASPRPIPPTPQEKVIKGLQTGRANKLREQQQVLRSKELGKRADAMEQALMANAGDEGLHAALHELKGALPRLEFNGLRGLTDQELQVLAKHVNEHPELTGFDKLTVRKALTNAWKHGQLPTKSEHQLLVKTFGPTFVEHAFNPSTLSKYKHIAIETLNIPRAVMASFDVSAPMRQGLVGLVSHPIISSKELGPMVKSLASEKVYRNWRANILERHPRYEQAKEDGLAVTDIEHSLATREEPFQSNYAERIPAVGHVVRASGRAYNRFLVGQRFGIYNHLLDQAESEGRALSPEARKQIAALANDATGRGTGRPGGAFERNAVELNAILFSPRLIKSRFDFLNPLAYRHLDPFVRREKIKMAAQTAAAISTFLYAMSRVAGVKVQADPRSSDFGKIRIGNTRIDIGGGFNQYIRVMAQAISNGEIDPNTGAIKHGQTPDILMRFARGKLAPSASLGTELLFRQNYAGQKIDPTSRAYWESRLGQMGTPLAIQDAKNVYDQAQHNLPAAAAAYAGSAVGLGIQSYGPPKPTGKTAADLRTDLAKNIRQYLHRGLTPQVQQALKRREMRTDYFKKVLPKRPGRGASDEEKKAYALARFNAQVDLLVKSGIAPNRAQARKAKAWAAKQDYHRVNSETSYIGRKYFGGAALSDAAKKIREHGGHFYLSDY